MPSNHEPLTEQYSSPLYIAFDESVDVDETEDELAKLDLSGTVADVGSGYGTYLGVLNPGWDLYIGVEPNGFLRQVARSRANELGVCCEFVDAVADNLPLRANVVDTILCLYVLNELETIPRIRKALEEMARVAKPGGNFFICDLTGGDDDGWSDLLNVAESARGCLPSRLQSDVWIEVFSFLSRNADIEGTERLDIVYRFADLEDTFDKFRALVPDLGTNPDVTAAVSRHFREPILETEAFLVRGRFKG